MEGKFKCKDCKFGFTYESSLLNHVWIHNGTAEEEYKQYLQNPTEFKQPEQESKVMESLQLTNTDPVTKESPMIPDSCLLVVGPMWVEQFLFEYNLVEPIFYKFVDCDEI